MKRIQFFPLCLAFTLGLGFVMILAGCDLFNPDKDEEEPPPATTQITYPPPSGGNVVGNWIFSRLDYQMNPHSDTLRLVVATYTNGTTHLGAQNSGVGDWTMTTGARCTLLVEVNLPYLGWTPTGVDTTWQDTTNSWGTYTIENVSNLVMTSTGTTTDPPAGGTEIIPYTVRNDSLILYRSEVLGTYNLDVWWLFLRQSP